MSLFCLFWHIFKFEEVGSSAEDTEEKVESFLALLEDERSFNFDHSNFQEGSSTITLMSIGKDPSFYLFHLGDLKLMRILCNFQDPRLHILMLASPSLNLMRPCLAVKSWQRRRRHPHGARLGDQGGGC